MGNKIKLEQYMNTRKNVITQHCFEKISAFIFKYLLSRIAVAKLPLKINLITHLKYISVLGRL